MNTASQGLETRQQILFDESLFDENLFDEHLESAQPVIKEMYEPAAPPVEIRQTTSHELNWDAKEFIPRHSPTPSPWPFLLPADSTLAHDLRLSSPIPRNLQTQLLLPPYGSTNLPLQHQKSFSPGPAEPDHLVSQNHPSSPLQCCSIEVNMRHPGSTGQQAQDSRMSHSPNILARPGQPVHSSVHPTIGGIQQHGLETNFQGIVPVSSFFTPVQSGHPHEVWNKLKTKI